MSRVLSGCLILALSLVVVPAVPSQDKKPAPPVTVTWYGQSFFTIKTAKGTTIAIDPHFIEAYGRFQGLKADLCLITHHHNDHTQVGIFDDPKPKVIQGLKGSGMRTDWNDIDETFKDVRIRSVGTYHDTVEGMRFGKNAIFILEMDGWKIAHLGDLGHPLSAAQLKKIGPVDAIMIPVGGIYSLNGSEAKEVVAQIKPKEYIFPMHYGTKVFDDLLPIDEFLQDQDRAKVTSSKDNSILLNRDPQRPRPLIVQLHYWPKDAK